MYVKNCLDCGVEFLAKNPHAKYCSGNCKARARRKANPEKFREQARARYATDPEKIREAERARRASDPEKFRERDRARYAADPEKFREAKRADYAADPEKFQVRSRVRRYSTGGILTAMMSISNAMKKLKGE